MADVVDGKLKIKIPGGIITVRGEPEKAVPDAEITGATYLRWAQSRYIESTSQRETPNGPTRDRALMFDALVRTFADDEQTRGKIQNHAGELVPFAADVIDSHAHTEAVSFLALELGIFFGYLQLDLPSAEGNERSEPPKTPRKPRSSRTSEPSSSASTPVA